jgi:hypothetical protein
MARWATIAPFFMVYIQNIYTPGGRTMDDELTLDALAKWHGVQAKAALDAGRAVGTREAMRLGQHLAGFHGDAVMLLDRIIRERHN